MHALSDAIGPVPAVTAAQAAGTLAMTNRIMDATGSRAPSGAVEAWLPLLEQLGAMEFPHADLVTARKSAAERRLRKIAKRLRA
ncbi:MAG: hypothetical protein ABFR53_04095 [Actinomycetota bacterium]